MKQYELFYATNRNHEGEDQWNPKSYGIKFSSDGMENLRFGKVSVKADPKEISALLKKNCEFGGGNGNDLQKYFCEMVDEHQTIKAYKEGIDRKKSEILQKDAVYGSNLMFNELQTIMKDLTDVLILIHGCNVPWNSACASAFALQEMLNRHDRQDPKTEKQKVRVVLFTWPSDGMLTPFVSYKSDRTEAKGSGRAFARGFLKLRDFLITLRGRSEDTKKNICNRDIHLLCHSMGNYVLQSAIPHIANFTPEGSMPRLFEHIFLCAADIDDTVFEPGQPMAKLPQLARHINVYYNRDDVAMYVSDYTKGNPERLGTNGAASPYLLHNKILQVDCTPIVKGLIEHGYFMDGKVNDDIRYSIYGVPDDSEYRKRKNSGNPQVWTMV